MGEIQHGTYDDECEGLTNEEISALYGFRENGEPESGEHESDENEASKVYMESDGFRDSDYDLDSDIEACLS